MPADEDSFWWLLISSDQQESLAILPAGLSGSWICNETLYPWILASICTMIRKRKKNVVEYPYRACVRLRGCLVRGQPRADSGEHTGVHLVRTVR